MKAINLFIVLFSFYLILSGCQGSEEQTVQESEKTIEFEKTGNKSLGEIDESVKLSLQTMMQPYYRLSDALAGADSAAARRYAGQIEGIIFTFDATTQPAEQQEVYNEYIDVTSQAAQEIQATTSLGQQRINFEQLSESLYQLLKKFEATNGEVHRMFCAEAFGNKGAYWLSNDEKALNPYSGREHPDCGTVTETF